MGSWPQKRVQKLGPCSSAATAHVFAAWQHNPLRIRALVRFAIILIRPEAQNFILSVTDRSLAGTSGPGLPVRYVSAGLIRAMAAASSEQMVVRVDQGALKSSWVPNQESDTCQRCYKGFSFLARRHHCRACGALVCKECSASRVFDRTKGTRVRVCAECFTSLQERAETGPPGTPLIRPEPRRSAGAGDVLGRKLAVLGFRGVGKSALVTQFAEERFVENYNPTIEATFNKEVSIRNVRFSTEIVDTAGMDEYMPVSRRASVGVHGYIIVYSTTSRSSFEKADIIHDRLLNILGTDHLPLVLVGACADLADAEGGRAREVQTAEGTALAQQWGGAGGGRVPFLEVSSKRNVNVTEAFETLLREIEVVAESGLFDEEEKQGQCIIL